MNIKYGAHVWTDRVITIHTEEPGGIYDQQTRVIRVHLSSRMKHETLASKCLCPCLFSINNPDDADESSGAF